MVLLQKIKIDNMREEHQEKLIKDAEKAAAQQKEAGGRERRNPEANGIYCRFHRCGNE